MMKNSFCPLYVTNFFGTLNDNFLKTLASFTVIGWINDERVKSIAAGLRPWPPGCRTHEYKIFGRVEV